MWDEIDGGDFCQVTTLRENRDNISDSFFLFSLYSANGEQDSHPLLHTFLSLFILFCLFPFVTLAIYAPKDFSNPLFLSYICVRICTEGRGRAGGEMRVGETGQLLATDITRVYHSELKIFQF